LIGRTSSRIVPGYLDNRNKPTSSAEGKLGINP
jgi:hypothetical protein